MKNRKLKKLEVEASIGKLNDVIEFINSELKHYNCDPELQNQINIAAEEIFVNIAYYAYKPEKGNVKISIAAGEELLLRFEDNGRPYNPMEHTQPDLSKPLMEREIGNLGIFLSRKIMDGFHYARVDNKNILTMTKRISNNS